MKFVCGYFLGKRENHFQICFCSQISVQYKLQRTEPYAEKHANLKFVLFNILELQGNTKESMIVSRVDRKRPAICIEKDAKDEKRYKPEGKGIIEKVNGRIMEETTKTLKKEKPQDVAETKENIDSELYVVGFC